MRVQWSVSTTTDCFAAMEVAAPNLIAAAGVAGSSATASVAADARDCAFDDPAQERWHREMPKTGDDAADSANPEQPLPRAPHDHDCGGVGVLVALAPSVSSKANS